MELIAQGAESKLYLDKKDRIIKQRFAKRYRISEIDLRLRKSRTKREAKVLYRLEKIGFSSPRLIETDEKEKIIMSKIEGRLVKDMFDKNFIKLSPIIGDKIALIHNENIIHGDLTTSNMIFAKDVFIIDYGLSFFSHKPEDKAVDLHLLRQSLESKHHKVYETSFKDIIKTYRKKAVDSKIVLERLEKVEKRGRYKQKKCKT